MPADRDRAAQSGIHRGLALGSATKGLKKPDLVATTIRLSVGILVTLLVKGHERRKKLLAAAEGQQDPLKISQQVMLICGPMRNWRCPRSDPGSCTRCGTLKQKTSVLKGNTGSDADVPGLAYENHHFQHETV